MHISSKPNPNANHIIPFPRNATGRKRSKRQPQPYRIVGQAWNAVRTLRDAEKRALADDPNSIAVLLLGQWRINLEKIARGRSVKADSWKRLATRMVASDSGNIGGADR